MFYFEIICCGYNCKLHLNRLSSCFNTKQISSPYIPALSRARYNSLYTLPSAVFTPQLVFWDSASPTNCSVAHFDSRVLAFSLLAMCLPSRDGNFSKIQDMNEIAVEVLIYSLFLKFGLGLV